MSRIRTSLFAALALLPIATAPAQTADVVLHGGRIHTMDDARTVVPAVAIGGGRIVATGDRAAVATHAGPDTRWLDLGGRTVIPGLIDSHLHAVRGGRFYNLEVRWDGVPTLREALAMLAEQAERTPKGQWLLRT